MTLSTITQPAPSATVAKESKPLRLAILQRVCPGYRTSLFRALCESPDLDVQLFIGADVVNTKVRSANDLSGINVKKLKTLFFSIGRLYTWHIGLIRELRKFKPDVILCEGESHFLGYVQAITYKKLLSPRTGLIHWCFTSLPGDPLIKPGFATKAKFFFRKYFDAHLLYSSFSKQCLVDQGTNPTKAFVATNVGNVERFLDIANNLTETPQQAKEKLGLPQRFTVLYTGTLDANKRPAMMLELSRALDKDKFNFVLVGSGELLEPLRRLVQEDNLTNVFLPGRVDGDLFLYYRASDAMVIPGRGGIVISEAMSFGLPVIVHQADGTEYDLVEDGRTGFHLQEGKLSSFKQALMELQSNTALSQSMRKASRDLVETRYNLSNMVNQIVNVTMYAKKAASLQ